MTEFKTIGVIPQIGLKEISTSAFNTDVEIASVDLDTNEVSINFVSGKIIKLVFGDSNNGG